MPAARKLFITSIVLVAVVGLAIVTLLAQQAQLVGSGATDDEGPSSGNPASCPSGTTALFSSVEALSVGKKVNAEGTVKSMEGSWEIHLRDNVPMAERGSKIRVEFLSDVLLKAALVYDNDPKSGEQPWSINGKKLPTTNNNTWTGAYTLDIQANFMEFDNGGDSPHFNVCISTVQPTSMPTPSPSPTMTVTPTVTVTPSVTPTGTLTPTLSPTVTITPSPTHCPLPEIPTVEILCQGCTSV